MASVGNTAYLLATSPNKARDGALIADMYSDLPNPFTAKPQKLQVAPIIRPSEAASESTPLLSEQPGVASSKADVDQPMSLASEAKILLKFGAPIYVTQLLESTFGITNVITVGRLGTRQLAGCALGNMSCAVVGWSVVLGFAAALDTLCPQAWTSSNPKAMSLHAQRTMLLLFLLMIPQYLIFYNGERILLALKQDPEIARFAATYMKINSCGLPGFIVFETVRRWLQAQGAMEACTFIMIGCAPINIALNYLLVWDKRIGIGFAGAPLANIIINWLTASLSVAYAYFFVDRRGWGGWDRRCLTGWHDNLSLGFAAFLATASEWYAGELTAFAVSWVGPVYLAAQTIAGNIQYITYVLSLSISSGAAVRIGNLIGAGDSDRAKIASIATLWLGVIFGSFNTVLLFACRSLLAKPFTDDPELIELVDSIIPIVAIYQIVDSVTGCAFGVLRGSGRTKQAAVITAFGYWLIGTPLGIGLLLYTPLKLQGVWIGITIALTVTSVVIDYAGDVEKARERAITAGESLAS